MFNLKNKNIFLIFNTFIFVCLDIFEYNINLNKQWNEIGKFDFIWGHFGTDLDKYIFIKPNFPLLLFG